MRKSSAALQSGSAAAGRWHRPAPSQPRTAVRKARPVEPANTAQGQVFNLAWNVMDGLLWYSGYRLFNQPPGPRRNLAIGFWGLTMLGVGGFQWILFGRKHEASPATISAGMVASSSALVAASAMVDGQAARAVVPLAAWQAFAFLLQQDIWRRKNTKAAKA